MEYVYDVVGWGGYVFYYASLAGGIVLMFIFIIRARFWSVREELMNMTC